MIRFIRLNWMQGHPGGCPLLIAVESIRDVVPDLPHDDGGFFAKLTLKDGTEYPLEEKLEEVEAILSRGATILA